MTHPLQHLLHRLDQKPWSLPESTIAEAIQEIVRYIIQKEKPDDVPRATLDDVF